MIWDRFGDVSNFVEPFAGSLATLLLRPTEPKIETVNDLDCYLANFWRALQGNPEEVARYADWPVNEADLHARHLWLVRQEDFRARMREDPDYYDAKIAGWWVWGQSQWIGSRWCQVKKADQNRRPWLGKGGRGVQRTKQQIPHLSSGGMGIHSPAKQLPPLGDAGRGVFRPSQKIPNIAGDTSKGVHAERSLDLYAYFAALAARLRRVRVCCGDWTRVLGASVLRTSEAGYTGVLLDPPYAGELRDKNLYAEDSDTLSSEVRAWALEHAGDPHLRIALCGYEGEHDLPSSWDCVAWKAHGGYGSQGQNNENASKERIWFSPGCLKGRQGSLFGGTP